MPDQLSLAAKDPARYLKVIQDGVSISRHANLLSWLQGDLQHYLPHDILISGWGNFEAGALQHDIVSTLPGMRSYASGTESLPLLLRRLHACWVAAGRTACLLEFEKFSHVLGNFHRADAFSTVLRSMRSVLVYGIYDERGRQESIYVLLRANDIPPSSADPLLMVLMSCIDMSMRRITHLPQQRRQAQPLASAPRDDGFNATSLSDREAQIMAWVAMGKTNSEIGTILNISGFTVKNHMQRIFQKLNVFNRTQAVSKAGRVTMDV